jgi:Protein of unknown function (DUF2934)
MEEKTKKKRVQKRAVRKTAKEAEPVSTAASPVVTTEANKPRKSISKPRSAPKRPKPAAVLPSFEQVQVRAYFISERRRKLGLPGDDGHDWLTAERELLAELKV